MVSFQFLSLEKLINSVHEELCFEPENKVEGLRTFFEDITKTSMKTPSVAVVDGVVYSYRAIVSMHLGEVGLMIISRNNLDELVPEEALTVVEHKILQKYLPLSYEETLQEYYWWCLNYYKLD